MTSTSQTIYDRSGHSELKSLLSRRDNSFWPTLSAYSRSASSFNELMLMSNLRKRAKLAGLTPPCSRDKALKVAIVGGSTLYPLSELVEHMLWITMGPTEVMIGDYNNYRSEVFDESSQLYEFGPTFVVVLPDERACRYSGGLADPAEMIEAEVKQTTADLLKLCSTIRERSGAEVVLCNFMLPSFFDLGPYRIKSPASDWNFRKAVNLSLSKDAANYVHICDVEFLVYRHGGLSARDERAWFESKQLCAPSLQVSLAKEIAHLISSSRTTPKKVLVLDLDNTLWGGVIGDDGLEGIEVGDTSPRGEAFKAFQSYVLSLTERGLLLGVCSKNDFENAVEPFRTHPEMVLREEHFVSFKANWDAKAKNLIDMAEELGLGLDSFIFVDDNPAEIEIVRQFAPDVETILLGDDPALYVRQLQESRLFERSAITNEDSSRTQQYKKEADRKRLQAECVDMGSYLRSLGMAAQIKEFNPLDLPRITQLINKSNQFNLTTKRRTEAELQALLTDPRFVGFSVRLADRFGDHGLISVVICHRLNQYVLEVDTWLMSCRVLKRQVEELVLNQIVLLARALDCKCIRGSYLPTAKNSMVRNLYPGFGFRMVTESQTQSVFELDVAAHLPLETFIHVESEPNYDEHRSNRSISSSTVYI